METCYECELCHKTFVQKSSRNRHVREQHLQPGLYQCKECGLRFSKKYNLENHKKHLHNKNSGKTKEDFKCSQCKEKFRNSTFLKRHINEQHESKKETNEISSIMQESSNEIDAQFFAESVLKELKQLQKEIQPSMETLDKQEQTAIETATVKYVTIKDNLYPGDYFKLLKVQCIKRVNGLTYFICEFCSKEFKKSFNFLRHRRIHTKVRPFICILCKKSFATTAQLKAHCTIHKLNENLGVFHHLYKCPQCKEAFSALQQLDKHLTESLACNNVTFQCPECLKSFKNLKSLSQHKHIQKDKELEMLKPLLASPVIIKDKKQCYLCNFCGFPIKDKLFLKQHEQRHLNLYKYQCTECRSSYNSDKTLKLHIKKIHLKDIQFKCQYCIKVFKTKSNCRRHMLNHLRMLLGNSQDLEQGNELVVNYPTFIENEETGQIENIEIHLRQTQRIKKNLLEEANNDANIVKYKCKKCNKSFRFKAWLKKHFLYKHTSEKPFECEKCLKRFKTKQTMELHEQLHNTERIKHICQVCGRYYSSPKSLKIHLRIHTQEKNFECKKCLQKFRTSGHLIQHKKSNHLGK